MFYLILAGIHGVVRPKRFELEKENKFQEQVGAMLEEKQKGTSTREEETPRQSIPSQHRKDKKSNKKADREEEETNEKPSVW